MGSRYVPPHLRAKRQQSVSSADGTELESGDSLNLVRRRLSDLEVSKKHEQALYTIEELKFHYKSSIINSTLQDSSSKPGCLGYVILWRGANPRWDTDQIIFAKTNIQMLPGYHEFKQHMKSRRPEVAGREAEACEIGDEAPAGEDGVTDKPSGAPGTTFQSPVATASVNFEFPAGRQDSQTRKVEGSADDLVPIFMEAVGRRGQRNVLFHGYFRLEQVDFLEPQSQELVRMLQQKWTIVQNRPNAPPRVRRRDPAAWAESLACEWAVLKFTSVPKDLAPKDPVIQILPETEQESPSDVSAETEVPFHRRVPDSEPFEESRDC